MTNGTISSELTEMIESPDPARFTILGSGVIGLLVANELAQQGHSVSVVSAEGKPTHNTDSTSANAVGQFLPWLPEDHAEGVMSEMPLSEIVDGARQFYQKLANNPHETGVMSVVNVELITDDKRWPENLPQAMEVNQTSLNVPIRFIEPDGSEVFFDKTYTFDTFSINTRKTVAHLAEQAEQAGVRFIKRKLLPEELHELDGIIVNAAGMGAGAFDSQEVKNYKGHTFVLKPHEGYQPPQQALSVEDLIIMPREDGTVVCGALYINDPKRPVPEEQEAQELQTRLDILIKETASVVEGLDPGLLHHSDILIHSAGYRVELAAGGIRIGPDDEHERLLHAYGFAGIGWSVGPHFAKKIAEHAVSMHKERG